MNCGNFANAKEGKWGFLRCVYMAAWEFVSPHFGCHFTPSRWVKANEE